MSTEPFELSFATLDAALTLRDAEGPNRDTGMIMDRLNLLGLIEPAESGGYRITPTGWQAMEVLMVFVALDRNDIAMPEDDMWPAEHVAEVCEWVQVRGTLGRLP